MSKKTFEYEILWFARKVKRKLLRQPLAFDHYAGKEVLKLEKANDLISQWILSGVPFMAARYGGIELGATWVFDSPINYLKGARLEEIFEGMDNNAGFFSRDLESLKRFSDLMKEASGELDLLGTWFFISMEDYMITQYAIQCQLSHARALEPWYVNNPWTASLKRKRVLIIHPFASTIRSQYEKREKLFPETEILPEFEELYIIKAVQTIAGERDERFRDWFEALEWMYEEAMRIDFDVAIIGCGAYGFPLAAKLKKVGKQAVHMGGATQLLFGIKGGRWDQHPIISKLYNEYWVRPDEAERPRKPNLVEQGCYW